MTSRPSITPPTVGRSLAPRRSPAQTAKQQRPRPAGVPIPITPHSILPRPWQILLLTLLLLLALAAGCGSDNPRPNIVLVMMDDFGFGAFAPNAASLTPDHYDPAFVEYLKRHNVAYEGAQPIEFARRAMPAMTKLAEAGVVFTNAHAASNLCAPSRGGVLTGRRPSSFGVYINRDLEESGLPAGSVLAAQLQQAGYATGMIGKWHAGQRDASLKGRPEYRGSVIKAHHPLNNGFDYYYGYNHFASPFYNSEWVWENFEYAGPQADYNTETFTAKTLEFMARSREQGRPFFVELAYHAVHDDLTPKAPNEYFDKFPSEDYNLTNFFAHVNAVDGGIQSILDDLSANGELENTLFLFCSDNGGQLLVESPLPGNAPYSGHKGTYREGGHRIPMLLHWPARIDPGQKRSELVSMMDLMPTALDAAGVPLPEGLHGKSLLPMLTGAAGPPHDYLLWVGIESRFWGFGRETTTPKDGNADRRYESPGSWTVSDGQYLLRYTAETPAGLFNDLPDGLPARYELYDTVSDPLETTNLYTGHPGIAARLEQVYKARATNLPPPSVWSTDRWKEVTP